MITMNYGTSDFPPMPTVTLVSNCTTHLILRLLSLFSFLIQIQKAKVASIMLDDLTQLAKL